MILLVMAGGCGADSSRIQSMKAHEFPLGVGRSWTYIVGDSVDRGADTITVRVVGHSQATDDEETSIWEIESPGDHSVGFITGGDTLFVARSGGVLTFQGKNECFPYLSLEFPLRAGRGWRSPDPSLFDSVLVEGREFVAVVDGGFPGAFKLEEHRYYGHEYLIRRFWIVPGTGIVRIEEVFTSRRRSNRSWTLLSTET